MKLTFTLIRTLMFMFILLPGLVFSTPISENSNDKKSLYSESNISIDVGLSNHTFSGILGGI